MINKTVKQIMDENLDKEIHLYDFLGIWGELPLTETNLSCSPQSIEINNNVINVFIG